jgi:hypothetical protein
MQYPGTMIKQSYLTLMQFGEYYWRNDQSIFLTLSYFTLIQMGKYQSILS